MRDPDWQGGNYTPGRPPRNGMTVARKLGTITYRSAAEWRQRFGRVELACSPEWEASNFAAQPNSPWRNLSQTPRPILIQRADRGTTCHIQGTVTLTGGGGDMTVDNTNFAAGQVFTVSNFTITAGNL